MMSFVCGPDERVKSVPLFFLLERGAIQMSPGVQERAYNPQTVFILRMLDACSRCGLSRCRENRTKVPFSSSTPAAVSLVWSTGLCNSVVLAYPLLITR